MFDNTGFISESQAVKERSLIRNVYMWMTAGLALTGVVSLWMMSNPARIVSMIQSGMFWGLIIGEFILVMFLSARIMSMSPSAATLSFAAYSVLNGITISTIFSDVHRGKYCFNFFYYSCDLCRNESLCFCNQTQSCRSGTVSFYGAYRNNNSFSCKHISEKFRNVLPYFLCRCTGFLRSDSL